MPSVNGAVLSCMHCHYCTIYCVICRAIPVFCVVQFSAVPVLSDTAYSCDTVHPLLSSAVCLGLCQGLCVVFGVVHFFQQNTVNKARLSGRQGRQLELSWFFWPTLYNSEILESLLHFV